jgi:hypothetical protein
MVSMGPGASSEDITEELMEQAAALWGRERAEAIRPTLEETARHLLIVARNLPQHEVEPGFHQFP